MAKLVWSCLISTTIGLAACGDGGQAAADAAMRALQKAYGAVKADAAAYMPDQARSVDEALAALQETFARGDYPKALTDVQGLTSQVGELGAAVGTRKAELIKAWEDLDARLSGIVRAIEAQVDELSKAKKLPPGVNRDAVDAARTGAATLSRLWDDAVAAFKTANLNDALAKALTVKAKAVELLVSLGQPVPTQLE